MTIIPAHLPSCRGNCHQRGNCKTPGFCLVTTNPHGRTVDTAIHEAPQQFEPTFEIDGPYELPDRIVRRLKFAGALVLLFIAGALLRAGGFV